MSLKRTILALRKISLAVGLGVLCPTLMSVTPDDFSGLDSRGIAEKIASDCRPSITLTDQDKIISAVAEYSHDINGGYIDYFSDKGLGSLNSSMLLSVVPPLWWDKTSADYKQVSADLNNIVPANTDVDKNRGDYPPGEVTKIKYTNGAWKAGTGQISGIETNLYEPAERYRGDLARIYMYMATAYPQALWHGRGTMMYTDGGYPLLTRYGRELLLKWHREDPVDENELQRNAVIVKYQGSGNPFVEIPDLAEYIWGAHSGETFDKKDEEPDPGTGGDEPDPTDPEPEPIMLKAVYSKSADGRIDFISTYVTQDSKWTFDGKAVDARSLSLDNVAIGRHEIRYTGTSSHGKIIITVEP